MQEYEFTLEFDLPNAQTDPADYVEQLHESGCDDALIGIGQKGTISLDFIREAASAQDAYESAIADIRQVLPRATLIQESREAIIF